MRPPPTKRCTGSYGLVQADRLGISPVATTPGIIRDLTISRISRVLLDRPSGVLRGTGRVRNAARQTYIPTNDTLRSHHCVSFLEPGRAALSGAPNCRELGWSP